MDANSILADEAQSIVTVKCFFYPPESYDSSFGISCMLKGNTWVFPWPFMRFPKLRLPKAEYR